MIRARQGQCLRWLAPRADRGPEAGDVRAPKPLDCPAGTALAIVRARTDFTLHGPAMNAAAPNFNPQGPGGYLRPPDAGNALQSRICARLAIPTSLRRPSDGVKLQLDSKK